MMREQLSIDVIGLQSREQQIMKNSMEVAEELLQSLLSTKRCLSSVTSTCILPCCPPTKKTRTQQKKAVRFTEDKIIRVLKATEDDSFPNRRWYQEQDYKRIKQENRDTLMAISKANGKITTIDPDEHCARGLELQISVLVLQLPLGNRQRKVVQSVLSMQQIQRKMKTQDAIALREMSLIISKQDKLKAWKTAAVDAYY
jgi:hypothetical protein